MRRWALLRSRWCCRSMSSSGRGNSAVCRDAASPPHSPWAECDFLEVVCTLVLLAPATHEVDDRVSDVVVASFDEELTCEQRPVESSGPKDCGAHRQRCASKKLRISATRISGTSIAGKCPHWNAPSTTGRCLHCPQPHEPRGLPLRSTPQSAASAAPASRAKVHPTRIASRGSCRDLP